MTPDTVVSIFHHALEMIIVLVSVILLPALVVGVLVSMFQAATQINEMTLSFIPKLLVTIATMMIAGTWLLRLVVEYTRRLIESIPSLIG
jgi:flagellar biosynthetic protein FliQ